MREMQDFSAAFCRYLRRLSEDDFDLVYDMTLKNTDEDDGAAFF